MDRSVQTAKYARYYTQKGLSESSGQVTIFVQIKAVNTIKHLISFWIDEWGFFRGDRVEVLVGKDKGKQGIVTQVIPERNWVMVEGLNWHYRTVGVEEGFPGILIKSEAPLDVSLITWNFMLVIIKLYVIYQVTKDLRLVDPSDLQGTEYEWRYTEEGEKVRVSARTGRLIPIPETNNQTHDYKTPGAYIEREKDTPGILNSTFEITANILIILFLQPLLYPK